MQPNYAKPKKPISFFKFCLEEKYLQIQFWFSINEKDLQRSENIQKRFIALSSLAKVTSCESSEPKTLRKLLKLLEQQLPSIGIILDILL